MLVEAGACLDMRDNIGFTPFNLDREWGMELRKLQEQQKAQDSENIPKQAEDEEQTQTDSPPSSTPKRT